jgi:hypothetical protein
MTSNVLTVQETVETLEKTACIEQEKHFFIAPSRGGELMQPTVVSASNIQVPPIRVEKRAPYGG